MPCCTAKWGEAAWGALFATLCGRSCALRLKASMEGQTCLVPLLALAQMGFVLSPVYEASAGETVVYVRRLMAQKNLRFEHENRVLQALAGVLSGVDWFDALLWAGSPAQNELATLDKKFANKANKLGWQPAVVCRL